MFCRECGEPVSETDKFCAKCGTTTVRDKQVRSETPSPLAPAHKAHSAEESSALGSLESRLIAAITLAGSVLAFVGTLRPWISLTFQGGSARYSMWDLILGTEASTYLYRLGSHLHDWPVAVGSFVAIVAIVFALAVPKLRILWAVTAAAAVLSLLGVGLCFTGSNVEVLHPEYPVYQRHEYGIFLTLAGSTITMVGGLLGLGMVTLLSKKGNSPSR